MTTEQAIAFFMFSIVAAVTPGPSNLILTSTGVAVGVLRGLPALLGVAAGAASMMFLVAFGLGSLVLDNPLILQILKYAGAAFLLWLAWKIATASSSESAGNKGFVGFWAAAVFQWINPKVWLTSVGAAGTYLQINAGSALVQSLSFGTLFFIAVLPSCFVWLAFGASLQRLLQTDHARRVFNIAMGTLLAASVILFVVE